MLPHHPPSSTGNMVGYRATGKPYPVTEKQNGSLRERVLLTRQRQPGRLGLISILASRSAERAHDQKWAGLWAYKPWLEPEPTVCLWKWKGKEPCRAGGGGGAACWGPIEHAMPGNSTEAWALKGAPGSRRLMALQIWEQGKAVQDRELLWAGRCSLFNVKPREHLHACQ